jgi:hypothetical protein
MRGLWDSCFQRLGKFLFIISIGEGYHARDQRMCSLTPCCRDINDHPIAMAPFGKEDPRRYFVERFLCTQISFQRAALLSPVTQSTA